MLRDLYTYAIYGDYVWHIYRTITEMCVGILYIILYGAAQLNNFTVDITYCIAWFVCYSSPEPSSLPLDKPVEASLDNFSLR